jgi:hypothetical protein
MNKHEQLIRRLYWLTAFFGAVGFVSYFAVKGLNPALGFAVGAACSVGNLWMFDWLSRAMAPGGRHRKPWKAALFVLRYLVLLGSGYAIVNLLGVNALTVILGLLASTAAVMVTLTLELLQSIFRRASSH